MGLEVDDFGSQPKQAFILYIGVGPKKHVSEYGASLYFEFELALPQVTK